MKRLDLTKAETADIVAQRKAGATWRALAKQYKLSDAGLRRYIANVCGPIALNPKVCPYCKKSFTPTRSDCVHCGHPDCYLQHRKENWQKWDRGDIGKKAAERKAGYIKVRCLGNYCGGKSFLTPEVKDHGRKRPLYRICPACRERNHENCTAWGGY